MADELQFVEDWNKDVLSSTLFNNYLEVDEEIVK